MELARFDLVTLFCHMFFEGGSVGFDGCLDECLEKCFYFAPTLSEVGCCTEVYSGSWIISKNGGVSWTIRGSSATPVW